jgi:DNA-binding Lrp family transcriptional regulator
MVPNWAIEHSSLTKHELLVYIVLLKYCDRATMKCRPGFRTIGDEARVSRDTVKRTIKSLEVHGIIKVERRRVNGRNLANVYTVGRFEPGSPSAKGTRAPQRRVGAWSTHVGAGSAERRRSEHLELEPENKTQELDVVRRDASKQLDDEIEEEATISVGAASLLEGVNEHELSKTREQVSFDVRASREQIDLLTDLCIQSGEQLPTPDEIEAWQEMTATRASELINLYRQKMGRGIDYLGPFDEDDPGFTLLTDQGKKWARAFMVPQRIDR